MSFYPCRGGVNLDNIEEKEFKNRCKRCWYIN